MAVFAATGFAFLHTALITIAATIVAKACAYYFIHAIMGNDICTHCGEAVSKK